MTDVTNAPGGADDAPTLTHHTTVADTVVERLPDYSLNAEEAAAVEGIEDFDPVADVPSPVRFEGGTIKAPERFAMALLSPEQSAPIAAALVGIPPENRAKREHELVCGVLYGNSRTLRVRAGSSGANAFQNEALDIARQVQSLNAEAIGIHAELAVVLGSRTVTDKQTGAQRIELIEQVSGDRRAAYQRRLEEIDYQVSLLEGPEGQRRLAKAKQETARQRLALKARLDDEREINTRAAHMEREDRLNRAAAARAKAKPRDHS